MLSQNQQKEELSFGYLQAVCAHAGIALERDTHDGDGIDGRLKYLFLTKDTRNDDFEACIQFQLKSTSETLLERDGYIHYPLKAKNYNDLTRAASCDQVLFLLVLPASDEERIIHSVDQLIIKKCMYWHELTGLPLTTNEESVTIRIHSMNTVSPENLITLLRSKIPSAQGENNAPRN